MFSAIVGEIEEREEFCRDRGAGQGGSLRARDCGGGRGRVNQLKGLDEALRSASSL